VHRARMLAVAVVVFVLAVAVGPAAAGGPSPGVLWGAGGVTDGHLRYVAVRAGAATLVEKIGARDGHVLASRLLPGLYGVPLVTYDGTAGGLSHDGRTLVVATLPGLPDTGLVTRFALLNAKTLGLRKLVALEGTFSFDAIAPDGSTVYVIEFTSQQNYDRYRVRALDTETGRLAPGAIVDKREPDEPMNGQPLRRVTSPDGSWVYTLYSRSGGKPFIHALDAARRFAVCLDLDAWQGPQNALQRYRLSLSGGQLVLSRPDGARVLAVAAPA
jgi:hypothetical protein